MVLLVVNAFLVASSTILWYCIFPYISVYTVYVRIDSVLAFLALVLLDDFSVKQDV